MGAINIQNLTKSYGDTEVLKGIDLAIENGEFLILVGPSGCGKSTLMNCIAGLEDITSGDLFIGQDNVTSLNPKDRDIAMVFQSYALYPTMTVAKNISFGLEMRNYPKAEIESTVQDVAKLLQIEHLLDRKPSQLSGGQRQRVAMGRALARSPRVFLFDEPLSNLDAKLRVEMRTEIKKLHKRLGTTIVYVTHDQVEAMTLADRIAVMKDGYVQQFGTPYEIYNDPANRFVADFMGSPAMNFIECVTMDGKVLIETHGHVHKLEIPASQALLNADMDKVVLGVRPEMITEVKPDNRSAYVTELPLDIQVIEPTGPDTLVFGSWNNQEVQARLSPEAGNGVQLEQAFRVQIDTSKAVLFDPRTGERVR